MTEPVRSTSSGPASFVGLVATLVRHPRLLFGTPVLLAMLAGLLSIKRGPQYTARADIKPRETDNRLGNVASLAAQLGVNAFGLSGTEGVQYYAEVLRSNEVLGAVARSTFHYRERDLGEESGDSARGTLADIWGIEAPSEEVRLSAAMRRLRSSIAARPNLAAGLLRFEVRSRWPELAIQINRRFLEALDTFNLHSRRSQAAVQRAFVEQRLTAKRAELSSAENELLAFENRNRQLQAPALALERQRLQRRVDVSQQVYLTLSQAYEQARIDEVRDTPVITVVDAPENTVERSGGVLLFLLLGGFVGGLLGLGLILLLEAWFHQLAEHPDDALAIKSAIRQAPWRLLRNRASTAP